MSRGHPVPGERIGPYEVGRRLGVGGMGVVFEATDTVLLPTGRAQGDRAAALEDALHGLSPGGSPARRRRRPRSTRRTSCRSMPTARPTAGTYLATQLIPGGDLGALLHAHGAPPARVAVDLIAQVASGLADAHATGLVHRDIKPSNVLLRRRDESLTAYLADFGIARRVDPEARHTPSRHRDIGTPTYMAPELHTGTPPGVASDVYSLGCLLWATLTGRRRTACTSEWAIVTNHRDQPVPQLAERSPFESALNVVLRRSLAKRPDDRYPSCGRDA